MDMDDQARDISARIEAIDATRAYDELPGKERDAALELEAGNPAGGTDDTPGVWDNSHARHNRPKTKAHKAPDGLASPTIWLAFRNLYYLAYAQYASDDPSLSGEQLHHQSAAAAQHLAELAYRRLAFTVKAWPSPDELDDPPPLLIEALHHFELTPHLRSFALSGRHLSRRALDQLSIAYAAMGYSMEDAYMQAYDDYCSIPNTLPLSRHEAFLYLLFFANFAGPLDLAETKAFCEHMYGEYSPEVRIINGWVTLDDLKATLSVTRGYNTDRTIRRVTQRTLAQADRISREMLSHHPMHYVYGGPAMMYISQFLSTTMKWAQLGQGLGSGEAKASFFDSVQIIAKDNHVAAGETLDRMREGRDHAVQKARTMGLLPERLSDDGSPEDGSPEDGSPEDGE